MSLAADVLRTLHLILQFGFVSVTVLLLLVTVVNRLRVRRVLLSWRAGRWPGLPLWPSVFVAAVVLVLGSAAATGAAFDLTQVAGYLVGGVFWFASSWLSASVLVTEYGLIHQPHRAEHAVAWGQVVDYFHAGTGRRQRYVFFYLDKSDARRRLELTVPHAHHAAFRKIVNEKLDARFEFSMQQVYGNKTLEG